MSRSLYPRPKRRYSQSFSRAELEALRALLGQARRGAKLEKLLARPELHTLERKVLATLCRAEKDDEPVADPDEPVTIPKVRPRARFYLPEDEEAIT